MRIIPLLISIVIATGFFSCTEKEILEDLELSFYDPEYEGPNPFTVTDTQYFSQEVYDQFGNVVGYVPRARVYFTFDESVLETGQEYGAKVDGSVVDVIVNGNFIHIKELNWGQTDYCSEVFFLDQLNRPVRAYENCYTVQF